MHICVHNIVHMILFLMFSFIFRVTFYHVGWDITCDFWDLFVLIYSISQRAQQQQTDKDKKCIECE